MNTQEMTTVSEVSKKLKSKINNIGQQKKRDKIFI